MNNPTTQEIKNWWLLSLIGMVLSVQALAMTMKVIGFLPMYMYLGIWLAFFIMGQLIASVIFNDRGRRSIAEKDLYAFLLVEAILTFLILSALVKMIFYDYKVEMAQRVFDVLLIFAVLDKLFWPQIKLTANQVYSLVIDRANANTLKQILLIIGTVGIGLIIFVPDHARVLARMYVGEQFHHYDDFIMAPGWAALNGHILDWDQISEYGTGMPYILSKIAAWMGGFSYEHVFLIIMTMTMVYYIVLFWFSQYWFNSIALGLAVMLWGIRVQMFHPGTYPFVLTYPSATVVRYFFDIFVMFTIYRHLQSGRQIWLLAAGALSGFSVFYVDSTGVFLLAAFYAYLACLLMMPYTRRMLYQKREDLAALGVYVLLPLLVALLFFGRVAGEHLLTSQFWHNFSETVEYFLSGIGTYPIYENFKYHNFWAGLVGLIIPAVWILTIMYVGAMCYFKKFSRRHILIIVICIYGLGVNHYYIARAVLTSYYVTGLPFVFVCGYWLKLLFWQWPQRRRFNAIVISLAMSLYALVTNHNFMAYPNIFNWSHNPMVDFLTAQPLPADLSSYFEHLNRNDPPELKLPTNSLGQTDEELYIEQSFPSDDDLVAYYHQDFDFSQDAQLIQALTPPGASVAVISSFEIKILIQADRGPFFYYFPLINSRPKHMRVMPINFLHTSRERFNQKAINQLQAAQPEYVFLEKIFLYNFPKAYADKPENIIPIVSYVREHYTPFKAGEYLVAMKRR